MRGGKGGLVVRCGIGSQAAQELEAGHVQPVLAVEQLASCTVHGSEELRIRKGASAAGLQSRGRLSREVAGVLGGGRAAYWRFSRCLLQ